MKRAIVIASILAATAARSRAQAPDPFDAFHDALARGHALVSVWGASHVAEDAFTSAMRDALSARHGDGGPGQFFPARPLALYDRREVTLDEGSTFRGVSTRGHRHHDDYGRAGMALDGSRGARACARLAAPATHFEAWTRGTIRLEVDGASIESDARAVLEVSEGASEVCIEAVDDVRSFGVIAERATGVVVESFGVPGARAEDADLWNDPSFALQLARRPPDLFVLSYGTNESAQRRSEIDLRDDLSRLLARFRRGAPHASCLVIGPSDRPRRFGTAWRARSQSTHVRDAYRDAAATSGCAFFDLLAWTGGPGSMADWALRGWALSDRVHFTDASYARLGRELAALVDP